MSEVQSSVERLLQCPLELTTPTTSFKSIPLTSSIPLQPQLWLITHDPTAMGRTLRAAGTTPHDPGWWLRAFSNSPGACIICYSSVRART